MTTTEQQRVKRLELEVLQLRARVRELEDSQPARPCPFCGTMVVL